MIKRSVYFEKRNQFWTDAWGYRGTTGPNHTTRIRAEEDCEAAEAAGVKWDPEEVSLPERITWRRYAAPLLFPEGVAGVFASPQEEEDCYNEAVRRYNSWPELRHLAANLLEECDSAEGIPSALKSFLAILDGKEAP